MNFSIHHTNTGKGVALILLLIHHLFFQTEFFYNDWIIGDTHILMKFAEFSKVCVGIFVFLSGFGLFRSQSKAQLSLKNFVSQHFVKIYLNYWLIWLLFVPVGLLFFDLSFTSIYGDNYWDKLLINILGFQQVFNFWGLNPTWWFIGTIIILYVLFPFIYTLVDKYNYIILLIVFVFSLFSINISFIGIQPYEPINDYLLTFVLGIIVAKNNIFEKLKQFRLKLWLKILFAFIVLLGVIILRFNLGAKSLILTDGLISLIIMFLIYGIESKFRFLEFIGKHSFNIFLFHTFIYFHFFNKFVFFTNSILIIFLTLLFICIFLSLLIEFIKIKLGFFKIQDVITNLLLGI